jgi:UDP-N-acetylmuramate--alanine ligase
LLIESCKSFHFIGIGGAGMSAIANVMLRLGYQVSGSDLHASETTVRLSEQGGMIFLGHDRKNLPQVDSVVVSSAIRKDNPELCEARDRGLPVFHRADVLAFLLNNRDGIAVAGSHGKTTTTSMIAFILDKAGIDPSVLIGGDLDAIGGNSKLGSSRWMVAEADESDGSFLKFRPLVGVVTNVENDHLDHYGSEEKIRQAFIEFLGLFRDGGVAVLGVDSPTVGELATMFNGRCITYAIDTDADYTAVNMRFDGMNSMFEVYREGKFIGEAVLGVPGRHNVQNALAAIAVAQFVGLSFDETVKHLSDFHGAKRRFQSKGRVKEIWVVDDYGHHPTEIRATLEAAKHVTKGRLVCLFQPHRFSRTQLLASEFGLAFLPADVVLITDVYAAGETPIPGVTGELIVREVERQSGKKVIYFSDSAVLEEEVLRILRPGDLLITMGAGNIYQTGERIVKALS